MPISSSLLNKPKLVKKLKAFYDYVQKNDGKVGTKRINITKVYYKTPQAMWRFYGYYGGLNTVGNLSSYGQWTDDSTFEVIPPWQNKQHHDRRKHCQYTCQLS